MGRKVEDLHWVGGEHDFALRFGEIEALQQKCDAGPEHIFSAIRGGTWVQEYLFETLRQGLIGGGMHAADAKALIRKVKDDDHPLQVFVMPAQVVLAAALVGIEDDEPEKSAGEAEQGERDPSSPEESGGSPTSTGTEPQ